MERCTCEKDWTARIVMVTVANGGALPPWWEDEIVRSGLQQEVTASWPPPTTRTFLEQLMDWDFLSPSPLPYGHFSLVHWFADGHTTITSPDLTSEQGVLQLMQGSLSREEWLQNTIKVSEANGGALPEWFQAVGGAVEDLYGRLLKKWEHFATFAQRGAEILLIDPQLPFIDREKPFCFEPTPDPHPTGGNGGSGSA